MEKFEETISDCNKSVELDPKYFKALLRRASAYESQKNYSAAFKGKYLVQ
jgi:hypothetical protein